MALLWQSRREAVEHALELALPTGAASLTIRLDGDPIGIWSDGQWRRYHDAVVWGAVRKFAVRDTSRLGGVVGVQFVPGMAAQLLGVPASEWGAQPVDAAPSGWGDKVRAADDPLACVEELLLGLRPKPEDGAVGWAVREIVKQPHVLRVEQLRRECGYSVRRFHDGFASMVGMAPKQFVRVRRFGMAVLRLAQTDRELAGLAADCGLYDQSHLNREFREFAGVTPGEYKPVKPEWPYHVVADEKFIQDAGRGL